MSNRTLVEINHDLLPRVSDDKAIREWALKIVLSLSGFSICELPHGVTFKHIRHHSDPDPMAGKGDAS